MTINPSLKFSSMDVCCVFDDGQQGLEMCVLHLVIILLYTNGFELLITEGQLSFCLINKCAMQCLAITWKITG